MLFEAARSVLVVVDVQERLAPAIHGIDGITSNVRLLMQAARRLNVPILITEQYPKGLGHTIQSIADLAPAEAFVEKVEFSAAANGGFLQRFDAVARSETIICGIEAHVCVLQTALQLRDSGVDVTMVRDAAGSRDPQNAAAAYERAARNAVALATTEMVVFEWLRRADHDAFKELSRLIK